MKKPSYAIATIQGRVASKPERGEWNGKEFADLDVAVVRKTYDGEEEMIVGLRTWNDKLFPVLEALEVNQGVQVAAELESKPQKTNGGDVYYRLALRPLAVVPGLAPRRGGASGAASPQRPQQAAQGGNYGSGNYTPPANGREAAQQAPKPAPLPHEDEPDLPF